MGGCCADHGEEKGFHGAVGDFTWRGERKGESSGAPQPQCGPWRLCFQEPHRGIKEHICGKSLKQQAPAFLAPGTRFTEDSSTQGSGPGGRHTASGSRVFQGRVCSEADARRNPSPPGWPPTRPPAPGGCPQYTREHRSLAQAVRASVCILRGCS